MNNKVLIGFAVFVIALLAAPMIMQVVRPQTAATPGGGSSPSSQSNQSGGLPEGWPPEILEPPLLNEANLIGSEWMIVVEQYKIKVTLQPGGICYAYHPMAKALIGMDYIEGKWWIQGDRAYVSTTFGGNEYSVSLKIAGNNLWFIPQKGKPEKVQRYH